MWLLSTCDAAGNKEFSFDDGRICIYVMKANQRVLSEKPEQNSVMQPRSSNSAGFLCSVCLFSPPHPFLLFLLFLFPFSVFYNSYLLSFLLSSVLV